MAEKLAPNFIRIDTHVTKDDVTLWISEDYPGEFPYVLINALGFPVSKGTVKAKSNQIAIDKGSSSGIYALVIGKRAFVIVKTVE